MTKLIRAISENYGQIIFLFVAVIKSLSFFWLRFQTFEGLAGIFQMGLLQGKYNKTLQVNNYNCNP